jgi:hypothetical protein
MSDADAIPPGMRWRRRAFLPTIGLILLATATSLYFWARPLYISIMTAIMLRPNVPPFFDFEYLLTNATCWRQGVDVYLQNPCDLANRPMGYSPLWLRMGFLAVDRSWSGPAGLALAVLFCLSLAALVPTSRWRDQLAIGLVAFSSLTFYGLERGNIDVIVYLFALVAGLALAGTFAARMLGYALLLVAGLFKFYPIIGLVVATRERLTTFIAVGLVSAMTVLGFFAAYHEEVLAALRNIPWTSYFWDSFGARLLPGGIAHALQPILILIGRPDWGPAATSRGPVYIMGLLLFSAVLLIVARIVRSADCRREVAALPPRYGALLTIGAVLVVGCFFTGQSVSYRAILLLLAMPGLVLLGQPNIPRTARLLARSTITVIVVVMFRLAAIGALLRFDLDPEHSAIASLIWMGFDLAWWWIVSILAGLLACSVLESNAWRDVERLPLPAKFSREIVRSFRNGSKHASATTSDARRS